LPPDVCLISPYPEAGARHGGHSGVASYTANLARSLAQRGAKVCVVAQRDGESPPLHSDGPVEVIRAYDPGPRALPRAFGAALRTGAPTIHLQHEVFLYGGAGSVAGLAPGLALGRRRGGAIVTMHHAVDPTTVDTDFVRLHRVSAPAAVTRAGLATVNETISRLARATVVHEAAFADHMRDAVVIPHGVERSAGVDPSDAREKLGVADGEFIVLCFGFLAPYKGLEVAMKGALLAGGRVRLVVAGGEHPRMPGYREELQLRFPDAATFTGRVPDAEVDSWFAAADLALFTYPLPFAASGSLALALAHGTPPLLSRQLAQALGAPADLAVDPEPAAVARRLRALSTDGGGLERMRTAAASLAAQRSWEEVARRHLQLYRPSGNDPEVIAHANGSVARLPRAA
jgi:glycosyltransferase involved in cell wall biosynthesis